MNQLQSLYCKIYVSSVFIYNIHFGHTWKIIDFYSKTYDFSHCHNQNRLWYEVLEGLNYRRTYLTLLTMYIEIYLPSPLFISIYNIWTMLCIKCIMINYINIVYCFTIVINFCNIVDVVSNCKYLRLLKSYESRNRNFNKLSFYRLITNWI